MSTVVTLENKRVVTLELIRCPVCGKEMLISKGYSNMPTSELECVSRQAPFDGFKFREKVKYHATLECPNKCCTIDLDYIDYILLN